MPNSMNLNSFRIRRKWSGNSDGTGSGCMNTEQGDVLTERGKEVLQWTGLSAKRNDKEVGGGGDERRGEERGNEQQSMNCRVDRP